MPLQDLERSDSVGRRLGYALVVLLVVAASFVFVRFQIEQASAKPPAVMRLEKVSAAPKDLGREGFR